jgi:glycosyltransferase involved in cell wall biosynthesis
MVDYGIDESFRNWNRECISPPVTIVMPVLNEADFIQQSLAAVLAQDYPADRLEILVIDGGSTDNTRQIAQELLARHPYGRLLDNPKQIQAAGLNVGILAARSDIIVRVDGHTLIEPDYVSTCVRYLQAGIADYVGGRMRPVGTTFVGQAIALATSSPFGIGGSKFHYSDQEQYVDTVYLGAYWRKTFNQIGLYDETFRINEDYELNYRLRQAGGKILLTPAIKSSYFPRSSLSALWRQYFKYGLWKVQTLQKHPASLRWRQAVPPLFVGLLIGSFGAGFFLALFFWLFIAIAGSYLLANLVASTISANRGGWQFSPILPVVFATIHVAWGLGFWYGLLLAPFGSQRQPAGR